MKKIILIMMVWLLVSWSRCPQETRANCSNVFPSCLTTGPVTAVAAIDVCTGTTVADVPVFVSSFNNIGIMSLKLTYDPGKLGMPVLLSSHPALWSSFVVNVSTPGVILVSGFGDGVTIGGTATLFTMRFLNGSGLVSGDISFVENVQGTSCEYAPDAPPDYTPFNDIPTGSYYIAGGITVHPPSYSPVPPVVSDLNATGLNIKWYSAETGGSALSASDAIISGAEYWASQTINNCESTTRFKITATIDPTPCAPTATTPQAFVLPATISDLTTLTGSNIRWYSVASGGSPLMPEMDLVDGLYFCTQTIDCSESATRFAVMVNVP
jgi:hypothetical protein